MPGEILHQGAVLVCPHSGQATPVAPNQRVTVSGNKITTKSQMYNVQGCGANTQCVTAQWIVAATRVTANGDAVLLRDSQAQTNSGSPLMVQSLQSRVTAQ